MRRQFLTQQEVADALGISVFTVRKWRVLGKCPAVKIGAKWHIPAEWLNGLIADAQTGTGTTGRGATREA